MRPYFYFWILASFLIYSCEMQNSESANAKTSITNAKETKGKIALELNGVQWANTSDIETNIFFASEDKHILDVHIGGQDQSMQGLGINLRVYRNGIGNLLGKYPIYANREKVEAYTAILNGNINGLSFDTEILPTQNGKQIGFLQIQESKVGYNRNGPFFVKLNASFEATFDTENQDGQLSKIAIRNGLIDLTNDGKSDLSYKSGLQINWNGKEWDSDRQEFSATQTDDGKEMAIVISATKSAMDMDPDNEGWSLRFYLDIPLSKIKDFKGKYSLGPDAAHGSLYLEHGEQSSLKNKADLIIDDMEILEFAETKIIVFIKGSFTIYPENGGKEIKGKFHIRDYDTGRI